MVIQKLTARYGACIRKDTAFLTTQDIYGGLLFYS